MEKASGRDAPWIERILTECRKTRAKVITVANQRRGIYLEEPT